MPRRRFPLFLFFTAIALLLASRTSSFAQQCPQGYTLSGGVCVANTSGGAPAGTGIVIVASGVFGTPANLTGDCTTSGGALATTCRPGVLTSTSGPVADPGGSSAFQFNNASGALTFNLAAGVTGYQRCYRNATGKSGSITVAVTTSNAIDLNGANGTSGTGTLVSGGALGDAVCLESDVANHWYATASSGTWTNN